MLSGTRTGLERNGVREAALMDADTRMARVEAALEQERMLSLAILDTVPALVVVLDPDFTVIRFNRWCELSTGYLFDELRDREIWPLFRSEEDAAPFRAAVTRLRGNVQSGRFESYWKTRDGAVVVISWTLAALFDAAGAMKLIIATGIDITENKRLENAVLEISAREQQRIGQDLHDGLGQHLTGIAFLAKVQEEKLADKGLAEAAEAAKIVTLVNEAIHKTKELARGLVPVLSGPYGLEAALQGLAGEVEDIFRVACRFEHERRVRMEDDGAAHHLFRIAQEAVHNAVRHGKAKSVVIRFREAGGEGVLSVRDDGSGIDFERLGGAGMGLLIMQYRARTIGGDVSIERVEGGGTLVSCVFPYRKASEAR